MERVAKYWRSYKNRLKTTYYKKYINTPQRWVCGDKDVDANQWREMVRHWDKERTTVSASLQGVFCLKKIIYGNTCI